MSTRFKHILYTGLLLLFLFPVICVSGQSSFTTYTGSTRQYHIDKKIGTTNYLWEVFTNANLTSTAGPSAVALTSLGSGRENEIEVTWKATGTYYLCITVTDNTGCSSRMAWTFDITANQPPVLSEDYNSTIETLSVDESDGSGNLLDNDVDPEGGVLQVSLINGDNSGTVSGTYGVLLWNADGTYSYSPNAGLDSLSATESVTDVFSETIIDDQGLTTTTTLTITLSGENDSPVANDDTNATLEGISVDETDGSGNLLANDSDPDGDVFTISSVNGNVSGNVNGTYGTLIWNSNGSYTYTPNPGLDSLVAGEVVTDYLSVTISDGNGGTDGSTLTITITGVNDPPVLSNDSNNTIKSTAIDESDGSGPLISNDFDIDGDLLSVVSINGDFTGTVSNSYGILVWHTNGTYIFTPNSLLDSLAQGESLVITYTYTASDGHGGTGTAYLTITVLGSNSNPIVVNDTNSTIETVSVSESDGSGNLLANDSDPENDPLHIESIEGNYSGLVIGIYGTLTWHTDGTYSYTPNSGVDSLYSGEVVTEIFHVMVSDGFGGSAISTLTVTINGQNAQPVANADWNSTIETSPVTYLEGSGNLLANDTDPDGDVLMVTNINSDITGTIAGTYGTLVWNANGTYTYTPNSGIDSLSAGEIVVDLFHISISDGHGGIASSDLNITIHGSNQLPVAVNDVNWTVEVIAVSETHGSGNLLLNDTDRDGDVLVIASINGITSGNVTGIYGTLVWNSNGSYSYKPNLQLDSLKAGESVTEVFTETVSDGNGGSATASLTITINGENGIPVIVADVNSTIETTMIDETSGSGNLLSNDSDPDGDVLTIVSLNGSTTPTIAGQYGTITWLSDGHYTYTPNSDLDTLTAGETLTEVFTEEVSDNQGITANTTLTITIHGENDAPVITNDTNTTVETIAVNETHGSGNILANDHDLEGDGLIITEINNSGNHFTTGAYGTLAWGSGGTYTYTPNAVLDTLKNGESVTELFYVKVSDGNGGITISSLTITISGENDLPVASNDTNTTIGATPVKETQGSGNLLANDHDPDNDPLVLTGIDGSSIGAVIGTYGTLVWKPNGTYTYTPNAAMDSLSPGESVLETFTETVSDGTGSVTSLLRITISGLIINHSPIANADSITVVEDTAHVFIDVLSNDSDPDKNSLSLSIISNPISGGTVSLSGGQVVYNPPLNYFGNDYFIYRICDNGDPVLCDADTVFIEVTPVNDAPVANTDYAATLVNPSNSLSIAVQSNDYDVDGDNLITTLLSGPTSGGSATVSGGKTLSYLPPVNFIGTDTIIYQVCDNGTPSLCDADTVFIRVVDELLAVDDNYEIYAGQSDDFAVLGNDLFIGNVGVTLIGVPEHGTVSLNSDETIHFIADEDYIGNDTITYVISNGHVGDTAIVVILIKPVVNLTVNADCKGELAQLSWQVSLKGVNASSIDLKIYDANNTLTQTISNTTLTGTIAWPGATLDQYGFAVAPATNLLTLHVTAEYNKNPFKESGTRSVTYPDCHTNVVFAESDAATILKAVQEIDVLENDSDPDEGDIDPATLAIYKSGNIQGPYHGSVSVNTNGTITYIPDIKYTGLDSFAYIVCDDVNPTKACDTAMVRLNVIWDDKLVAYDDHFWTYQADPKVLPVTYNDYDPDNSLDLSSLAIITPPSNGTVTVNKSNGTVTYTPSNGFIGRDSFYYEICNTQVPQVCDQAWTYIDVVENSPVIAVHDEISTGAEEGINIAVLTNDSDPEGAIDTLSLVIVNSPIHGTVTLLEDGTLNYVPDDHFAGADSFIYQICDSGFPITCDTAVVHVQVIDNNKAIVANPDKGVTTEATPVEVSVLSNDFDPDGTLDLQSLTIIDQPNNGTITIGAGGIIVYQPNGTFFGNDTFIYQICDNGPVVSCDTALVTLSVVENLSPVAIDDTLTVYGETSTLLNVLVNDYDPENDLDSSTVELVDYHSNAIVSADTASGMIVYTPNSCFYGYDTLYYQVYDGVGNVSNIASVIIQVTINPNLDSDNDGVSDLTEDLNGNGNPCDDDTDLDLIPNYQDDDDDGDGVITRLEDWDKNGDPADDNTDGDTIPNYLDNDDDNDSILTYYEDVDGDNNYYDDDTNGNGVPNYLDADDDGDGFATIEETGDLDGNGVADYLEVWNSAAVPDYLGIAIEETVDIPVLDNDSSQMVNNTLHIVQYPNHGTATVDQTNWTISYTPEAEYSGPDSMIYEVCDYYDFCDTAVVKFAVKDWLYFPQLFTPNGDGNNDYYMIVGIDKYPDNQFIIYNRWGNKVYEKTGYQNDWNGLANVKFVLGTNELPVGVYYYILRFNGNEERQGALFLDR